MMLPSVTFQSLEDFNSLATIRRLCTDRGSAFQVTDISLSALTSPGVKDFPQLQAGDRVQKTQILTSNPSFADPDAKELLIALHRLARIILANFSHALGLPWEEFLGEMHELHALGSDELRVFGNDASIPNNWSTMVIVLNAAYPDRASIICGEAMSVFSNNVVPTPKDTFLDPQQLPTLADVAPKEWISYYVRPNADVFYSRAGAESRSGRRVRELQSDFLQSCH